MRTNMRRVSVHEQNWSSLLNQIRPHFPFYLLSIRDNSIMKVSSSTCVLALWGSIGVLAAPVDPPNEVDTKSKVSLSSIHTRRGY